jgi:sulfur carrier protein
MAKITLNGEERDTAARNLAQLAAELHLTAGRVAALLNSEVAPKAQWDSIALADGDEVEFVTLVGGG